MPLVISDELEARLAQLGYMGDVTSWEIGDLCEYIYQLMKRVTDDGKEVIVDPQTEEVVPTSVLYNAVAKAANKSPHAVRDYRYTSRRVPISLREEYHQLGRHHWKCIIPRTDSVKEMREICDWILESASDYGGAIISVAALRMKLAAKEDGGERAWAKTYRLARKHCEKLLKYEGEEAPPPHLQYAAESFLKAAVPLP